MKSDDLMNIMKSELEDFVEFSLNNAKNVKREMLEFVDSIKSIVDQAVEERSTLALNYLRDAISSKATNSGLTSVREEKKAVIQTIVSILRTFIEIVK